MLFLSSMIFEYMQMKYDCIWMTYDWYISHIRVSASATRGHTNEMRMTHEWYKNHLRIASRWHSSTLELHTK